MGSRVNMADFVALRQAIEMAQLVQACTIVSRQAVANAMTKPGSIIVCGRVSLVLISAQARVEPNIVEKPAMQPDSKLAVFLVERHEERTDKFVNLTLHFDFEQRHAPILARAPCNVIEVAYSLENCPEVDQLGDGDVVVPDRRAPG